MADEQTNEQNGNEDEPKTRTRSTGSSKNQEKDDAKAAAEQRKAEKEAQAEAKKAKDAEAKEKRDAERKEREEKREQEKKEREEKRAAEKEAKEKERQEAKEAKEREKVEERQRQIDDGEIIFADFEGNQVPAEDTLDSDWSGVTFALTEPKKEEVANRARSVIQDLINGATEVPMSGKDLADEYGGGTVQWVAFFGMLRVLGYVQPYRFRTGERGESGLAYKWVGPTDDEFLNTLNGTNGATDEDTSDETEQVEEPAAA